MTHNTFKVLCFFGVALAVFVGIVTLASGILFITLGHGFNGVLTILGSITNFVLAVYLYKTFEAKDLEVRKNNKPNLTR